MEIAYLAGWQPEKDAIFEAIARAVDRATRLPVIGVSPRGFAETRARTEAALAAAKHQPRGLARQAKRALIAGQYNWARRYFGRHPDRAAVCWNGLTGSRKAFMDGACDAGARRLFVERAPLPGRVTLDPAGVNYAGSLPRDPAFYRDWAATARPDRDTWRAMAEGLASRASRRADVGQGAGDAALDQPYLFCPLQVPNDSQVRLFSDWVRDLPHMVEVLADAARGLPAGWCLRVKEHPSARQSLADPLAAAVAASEGRLIVDNQTDTFAQVEASRGVLTLNSSVGLQAFFYDKPVVVLGQALFGLPGLVVRTESAVALAQALADPDTLTFDQSLRDVFMAYLDQVYYPKTVLGADGTMQIDPAVVRDRIAGRL